MKQFLFKLVFKKATFVVFLSSLTTFFIFQNCSPVKYESVTAQDLLKAESQRDKNSLSICQFNGVEYQEGGSVVAYLQSSVVFGQSCTEQNRICTNGSLSGSYAYATCEVAQPAACLFDGKTIGHATSVTAYRDSSVEFGTNCVSEVRSCDDGRLTGSYSFSQCNVGVPKACRFNDSTIDHSKTVKAFKTSNVAFGKTCEFEDRACTNGSLSGTYAFASCTIDTPKACLFNGMTVTHGQSIKGYQNSAVAFGQTCVEENRICTDGALSGSFNFASCVSDAPKSCLFNGQTIAHGASARGYLNASVPSGQTCSQEDRICSNGVLSGSYSFASCGVNAPQSCLFNGQTIAHGQPIEAFQNSSVAFGDICVKESRVCSNGTLSGAFNYATCSVTTPKSCLLSGLNIAHGESAVAFQNSSAAFGSACVKQDRLCNNGVLSGSFNFASCAVDVPKSCLFNGQTIAHNASTNAFANSTVSFGQSCVGEERKCVNGVLSGSFLYGSCAVDGPKSCLFNGMNVASGELVQAFQNSSVAYGSQCVKESRQCLNGNLSGTYAFGSCAVNSPKSCTFNGLPIASGQSVAAFQNSSVAFGASCTQELRTCLDGVLSGSYVFNSCAVDKPKSCLFNGTQVAHGSNVNAFLVSTVAHGQQCTAQVRNCNDGALSGSYSYESCNVGAPASCTFNGASVAHGASVAAFGSSSVSYNQVCSPETRICNNGALSGSFSYASCVINAPKSCMFNGAQLAHGQTATAYFKSTVSYDESCTTETRTCADGILSGSATFTSCQMESLPSVTASAASVNEGGSITLIFNLDKPHRSKPITVNYSFAAGALPSAQSPADFNGVSGQLTIAAGTTRGFITVATVADGVFESNENLKLKIDSATNATIGTSELNIQIIETTVQPQILLTRSNQTNFSAGQDEIVEVKLSSPVEGSAVVKVTTQDLSAVSGVNYSGFAATTPYMCSISSSQPICNVPIKWITSSMAEGAISSFVPNGTFFHGMNSAGQIFAWGRNAVGVIGDGTSTNVLEPKLIDLQTKYKFIDGRGQICGITSEGYLKCWGGDFGSTPKLLDSVDKYVTLSSGSTASCGITISGQLKCWGRNFSGQIGDGKAIGNTVVPPTNIDVGVNYLNVSVGNSHVCAVTVSNDLKCWGMANWGELGDGKSITVDGGRSQALAPKIIDSGTKYLSVSAGTSYTCGLMTSEKVKCWGEGSFKQLGNNATSSFNSTPIPVDTSQTYRSIVAGYQTTCGITTAGNVRCWGANGFGECGSGGVSTSLNPTTIDVSTKYKSIYPNGRWSYCGITESNQVKCWGMYDNTLAVPGLSSLSPKIFSIKQPISFGVNASW